MPNPGSFPIPFDQEDAAWLAGLKVGDPVERWLGGAPMRMEVSRILPDRVVCALWEFCRMTGVEIDEELGWGPKSGFTGSYIRRPGN